MKQKYKLLLLLVVSIAWINLHSQHTANSLQKGQTLIKTASSWLPTDTDFCYLNYIENKGQWIDKVLYQSDFHGGRLFLEKNALTYVFFPPNGFERFHPHEGANPADFVSCTMTFQAIRMEFANSLQASIKPATQREFYNNYFLGNDHTHWASKAHAYGKVYYNELYPGISAKIFSRNTDVRYDFIVSPNADPSLIKLRFAGQNGLSLKDGKLILKTEIGDIEEAVPFAYQVVDGKKVKVDCDYVLNDDEVGFKPGDKYNHSLPLVIDPTLVFSTFTGSTADNWGMSATYDALGDGYTSGICFNTGYPVTVGAFQMTFQGGGTGGGNNWPPPDNTGFDIVVSKFNPGGTALRFSTYLGGSDNEEPSSLIVDNNNNLVVLGRSYSTNFPTTSGAFSTTNHGGADLIISKFDSSGTALLASTYVGGSGDDGVNMSALENVLTDLKYNYADDDRSDVIVDNSNNVYVASCTNSPNFPTTPGAYRTSPYGMQDACMFKLNSTFTSLVWSTYLGGSDNDAAYNIALNSAGEVYVTGGTESNNFPVTAGVIDPTYGGNIDGFLCHFSANGATLINSTYIGTAGYDQSYFVQTDKYNKVYVYGQTSGAYPITAGVYSNTHSGQFIHELNSTLTSTVFSTEFGSGRGTPDIAPSAFLVDDCQNIYVAGWGGILYGFNVPTSSTLGLPITGNAYNPNTNGNDFYFMVLQSGASALWYSTFFGGTNSLSHVDGGTSRFDKNGIIYQAMCAGCGGFSDIPTTPSAWSTTNRGPNCNNALVKFQMDLLHTVASFVINPFTVAGCAPFSVTFDNTTNYGHTYQWDFGDGGTSTAAAPSHVYINPGIYNVRLVAIDSSTCNLADTAYSTVRVVPPLSLTTNPLHSTYVCLGDSINLNAISPAAISFAWTPSAGLSNTAIHNPNASPAALTSYVVIAKDSFCTASDTILVNVYKNTAKIAPADPQLCLGDSVKLYSDSVDASYVWSTGQNSPFIYARVGGQFYLNTIDMHGCKASDTVNVQAFSRVLLQLNDTSVCLGYPADLRVDSGNYIYQWMPPTGLNSSTIFNPVAKPTSTTAYTITLTNGPCVSTGIEKVTIQPNPSIQASPDSSMILYGESVMLTATGDPGCFWYPPKGLSCTNCNTPVATPDTNSLYYVKVYNRYGCFAVDSAKIDIEPAFFIPSAFTPNGDGLNEVFRPKFGGYISIDAYIFNRWGALLYHWNTLDGGWDGTCNGAKVPEDVYIYSISATSYDGQTIHKVGNIAVLK